MPLRVINLSSRKAISLFNVKKFKKKKKKKIAKLNRLSVLLDYSNRRKY